MDVALWLFVFWLAVFVGVFSRRQVALLYLFFATLPLGAFAVLPVSLSAGATLLPSHLVIVLLALKELFRSGPRRFYPIEVPLNRRAGAMLLSYLILAAVVTYLAPRHFSGQILVIPMSAERLVPTPLAPTAQNFTQLAYLGVSVLGVFTFARIATRPKDLKHILKGILLAGMLTALSGAADLYMPNSTQLLAGLRTASYSIQEQSRLADGTQRVAGLMPEASAYASLTVALLAMIYFLLPYYRSQGRTPWAHTTLIALGFLLGLSASSSGYVGAGTSLALVISDGAMRFCYPDRFGSSRGIRRNALLTSLAVTGALLAIILVAPSILDPVLNRLDDRVLQKTSSASFAERSEWTAVSFAAALESNLIGVGVGSTRASNYLVSVLAGAGLAGFALYFSFVGRMCLSSSKSSDQGDRMVIRALRWSYPPALVVNVLVGTSPDFGTVGALRWGVLLALLPAAFSSRSATSIVKRTQRPDSYASGLRDSDSLVGGPKVPGDAWR